MHLDSVKLKEMLLSIVKTPIMYVGKPRVDYFLRFIDGINFGNFMYNSHECFSDYIWEFNYDLQKWIFINESVSITSMTINSWSLIQRCYGNGINAFKKLATLLNEIDFTDGTKYSLDDTVAYHIYQVYSSYKPWGQLPDEYHSYNSSVSADYYPVSELIKANIGEVIYTYESIIPFIIQMIDDECDNLFIYIHYGSHFLCVKFIYYSKSKGWVECKDLVNKNDYYYNLIILHAYARLIQKEEHESHVISLNQINGNTDIKHINVQDYWHDIFNPDNDIQDYNSSSFDKSYSKWKEAVLKDNWDSVSDLSVT